MEYTKNGKQEEVKVFGGMQVRQEDNVRVPDPTSFSYTLIMTKQPIVFFFFLTTFHCFELS